MVIWHPSTTTAGAFVCSKLLILSLTDKSKDSNAVESIVAILIAENSLLVPSVIVLWARVYAKIRVRASDSATVVDWVLGKFGN